MEDDHRSVVDSDLFENKCVVDVDEEDEFGGDFEVESDESDYGDESDDFDEIGEDSEENEGDVGEEDESDATDDDTPYTVLMEEDIRNLQQQDITQVSNTLSIPRVSATILLRHYNWNVEKAQDEWFADGEKVRKDVGLLEEKVEVEVVNEGMMKCRICLDEVSGGDMCAAACGHLFCKMCWRQYVSIKISDGPGCLMLRCPDPSCAIAVGQDMVDELVSEEDKERYSRFLYRSYVEDRRKMSKWCPGTDCECAVEFVVGGSVYDVVCCCGHSFCWNCVDDAHSPVDCDTVHNWAVKNCAESENVTWILANSKACPSCKKPINKNEGCMHMTCTCKFEFCWLCLGDWKAHGKATGGFYACNVYEQAKAEGKYKEEEEVRKQAKEYLDKYAFFYERFVENQKSRQKAVESLQNMQSKDFEILSDRYRLTKKELQVIITDAWLQIIECRRVLKWTYVYGYYLPESEHFKKHLFEDLQGQAQSRLESLHRCAETELKTYLNDDAPDDFIPFSTKLLAETLATKTLFGNLVQALDNGLSEVDSEKVSAARNGLKFRKKEDKK